MGRAKVTRKDKAYKFFSEGFLPSSQELKDLGLAKGSRYTYYSKWKEEGQPVPSVGQESKEVKEKAKPTVKPKTGLPGGETIGSIHEPSIDKSKGESEELREPEPEPEPELEPGVEPEPEPEPELEPEPEPEIEPEPEPEAKPEEKEEKPKVGDINLRREGEKKPSKESVVGEGLVATVSISVKTLALYQYAATQQEGELTFGDFIDTCVEDVYRGRGLDLGLVKIGGKK